MAEDGDPRGRSIRAGPALAAFWDERYHGASRMFGAAPNAFIRANTPRPGTSARALVPGDGYGRNGVWLATRGYRVLSVDISPVAIEAARAFAAENGVEIEAEVVDLTDWTPEPEAFDLVAVAFVHFPEEERIKAHARLVEALAPGGLLMLQAYSRNQIGRDSGGPQTPLLLHTTDQLAADFASLEIERLAEAIVDLDEGTRHRGVSSVIELLARKPAG